MRGECQIGWLLRWGRGAAAAAHVLNALVEVGWGAPQQWGAWISSSNAGPKWGRCRIRSSSSSSSRETGIVRNGWHVWSW
jgi:hypothetical protein